MAKKKVEEIEEEEEEEILDDEDEEIEDETFKCRLCKKEVEVSEGDDLILVCDKCGEQYNLDKFWGDYDKGKIEDDQLTTFDLEPYKLPPKPAKKKKTTDKK